MGILMENDIGINVIPSTIYNDMQDKANIEANLNCGSEQYSTFTRDVMANLNFAFTNTLTLSGGYVGAAEVASRQVNNEVKYHLYGNKNEVEYELVCGKAIDASGTALQYYEIIQGVSYTENVILVSVQPGFLSYLLDDVKNLLTFLRSCITSLLNSGKSVSVGLYTLYTRVQLDDDRFTAIKAVAS